MQLLKDSSGWTRLVMVLCVIWIVCSNVLYFSGVGEIHIVNLRTPENSPDYVWPVWQQAWHYVTFRAEITALYEIGSIGDVIQTGKLVSSDEYRWVGHVTFMLLPIAILWLVYAAVIWIFSGFKSRSH